jgi:hypothetical protein
MVISTQGGWLVGDAVPEPADGLYWHPDRGMRVLMPIKAIVDAGFPSQPGAPERCKLCRAAIASHARSLWGPSATGTPWAPRSRTFDLARPAVEAVVGHAFWQRIEVVGSLLHVAVLRQEAATTVDLAVRFDDGGLGLLAIWSGPDDRIHPLAPWAELGAAVGALADSGIPLAKVVVAWVSGEGAVKVEAKPADDALGAWVDAVDLERALRRHSLVGVQHATR